MLSLPLYGEVYLGIAVTHSLDATSFWIINQNAYFSLMKESKISLGAGIGLIAGIIIGNATDNVGLWIALGLCFGAGIGEVLKKKNQKN